MRGTSTTPTSAICRGSTRRRCRRRRSGSGSTSRSRSTSGWRSSPRPTSSSTRSSGRRASGSSASRGWREEIAGVLSSRPGFFSGKTLSAEDLAQEQEYFRKTRAACGGAGQGRPHHRDGRRVPGAAGADGPLLRDRPGRGPVGRRGDRGSLQAGRPLRPRPHRPGGDLRRARRQARPARRVLGDRREADREQGPVCAPARGARGDPDRAGEWAAAAADPPLC